MKTVFRVPVRQLAEFCYRRGNLNREGFSPGSLQKGLQVHQKIQASRGAGYQPEVPVSRHISGTDYELIISGRIDGVFQQDDRTVLEEIKSTSCPIEELAANDFPENWAQVQAYGALYAAAQGESRLGLRLVYCHSGSGVLRTFSESYSATEMEQVLSEMLEYYCRWLDSLLKHRQVRNRALDSLTFPFPEYRKGQTELMERVSAAITSQGQLLAEAPTGLGKTLAALYPAVQSLANSRVDKVFFLTARSPGKRAAESALKLLKNGDRAPLKWVSITAREKICFQPDTPCNTENCEFARGYFDRISTALEDCFKTDAFPKKIIEEKAHLHRVCPFELSLELTPLMDVIICDDNYVFDPRVYLRRFFTQKHLLQLGDSYVFIVDEAHNLVDRAREMYSASLVKQDFLKLKRTLGKSFPQLGRAARDINSWFISTVKELEYGGSTGAQKDIPAGILLLLKSFLGHCETYLAERAGNDETHEMVLQLYFDCLRFVVTAEGYDEHYASYFQKKHQRFQLNLLCLDPSVQLSSRLKNAVAAIFLSATLSPVSYFRKLLGCTPVAEIFSLPSPYPAENLCVLHMRDLSVRYRLRRQTASQVAEALEAFTSGRTGNYLIYFPSYEFLEMIRMELLLKGSTSDILVQTPGMTEDQRQAFLGEFTNPRKQPRTGLAVMGGIFGESIDLVGEQLTGVCVICLGLPAMTMQQELIKHHFDAEGDGFGFAYLYPGLTRVIQAAGRLIRSQNDRGALLLIDDRFASDTVTRLLPENWHIRQVENTAELQLQLQEFWSD